MTDHTHRIVVTWEAGDRARRTVFEPRSDGRFDRREQVWTAGEHWRECGSEIVDRVGVETADGLVTTA